MKIKIKKIVQPEIKEEYEIEVTFPRYSKDARYYYGLISEGNTIVVDVTSFSPSINFWEEYNSKAEEAVSYPEITEEEFMTAYREASLLINAALNKSLLTI